MNQLVFLFKNTNYAARPYKSVEENEDKKHENDPMETTKAQLIQQKKLINSENSGLFIRFLKFPQIFKLCSYQNILKHIVRNLYSHWYVENFQTSGHKFF